MPFENLNNNHFTPEEKDAVLANLAVIEAVLSPKFKNLSPEERQKYGSVNEQNKLIINKIMDFRNSQPALSSPDVDWAEFAADFDTRAFLQTTMNRMQDVINSLNNNKILHDFDNYQASLTDYEYSRYKMSTKTAGYETKCNELAQFFNRTGATSSTPNP
jgi:hypothetical protein